MGISNAYPKAYELTKVLTASNREVLLYLYEGADSLIQRAITERKDGNTAEAGAAIERVISVLIELSCCLDYNQNGSLAVRLDSLYNYMIHALTLAAGTDDLEALETSAGIMHILGDAWRQAIATEKNAKRAAQIPQLQLSA